MGVALVSLLLWAILRSMTGEERLLMTRGFEVLIPLLLLGALFSFFLKVTCHRILRRQSDREYFQSIVSNNRLEFPSLRKDREDGAPIDYPRLRMILRCDFLALTFLLKNATNPEHRYSREERLLTCE